jgi:hypothetical protein
MNTQVHVPNPDTFGREEEGPATELSESQDDRLDEELVGTFPASDPIPWRHGS